MFFIFFKYKCGINTTSEQFPTNIMRVISFKYSIYLQGCLSIQSWVTFSPMLYSCTGMSKTHTQYKNVYYILIAPICYRVLLMYDHAFLNMHAGVAGWHAGTTYSQT